MNTVLILAIATHLCVPEAGAAVTYSPDEGIKSGYLSQPSQKYLWGSAGFRSLEKSVIDLDNCTKMEHGGYVCQSSNSFAGHASIDANLRFTLYSYGESDGVEQDEIVSGFCGKVEG